MKKINKVENKLKKRIFVSHSEKDEEIVGYFTDDILIQGLGFNSNDIYCTSQLGMKNKPSEDWLNTIKENLEECEIIFFIITPNFKNSEVCQNELGASWALNKVVFLLCIEPIAKSKATVLYDVKQVEELNKEDSLDRVRDVINDKYITNKIGTDRWGGYRKRFMTKLNRYLTKYPFRELINEEEYLKLKQRYEESEKAYNELFDENEELKEINQKLIECKDKSEVEEVLENYTDETNNDIFDIYIKETREIIKKYHPSIITLIFNTYTGTQFEIDMRNYRNYIEEAKANKILDIDTFDINFCNDKKLVKLEINLDKIDKLISSLSSQEYENICEKYDVQELDVKRLDFWEEVIGVKLDYLN